MCYAVLALANPTAKRYGLTPPEKGGWTYHSEFIPRFRPDDGKGLLTAYVSPTNPHWQREVLESCRHLIDLDCPSIGWDQFADSPTQPSLLTLVPEVRRLAKRRDPQSTLNGESASNIDNDALYLDYTWDWFSYPATGDVRPFVSAYPAPRLNVNIDRSPRDVRLGLRDNLYSDEFSAPARAADDDKPVAPTGLILLKSGRPLARGGCAVCQDMVVAGNRRDRFSDDRGAVAAAPAGDFFFRWPGSLAMALTMAGAVARDHGRAQGRRKHADCRGLGLGTPNGRSRCARIAHRLVGQLEIVVQAAMGPKPQLGEHGVIRLDGLDGPDLALDDQPQEMDEGQLVLGVVDLAAEEGDLGPVFLGVVEELKGVARGAGRAAQDADDQVRVEPDQLFHRLGAVIDHLEEQRAGRSGRRPPASA